MTRMRVFITLTVLLVTLTTSAWAAEPFMPRYPSISPDGSTVVFSFQGDLWSVASNGGMATRLTVHPAYESLSVFSPDGSIIAFGSDRHGDVDVYTIPATGGTPTRLTHASTTDAPYAFSNDGETIYFASSRLFDYPMERQIQAIPVDGGTPFRVADMYGNEVAIAPDGSFIIAEGRKKFGRMNYRGSYQRDLYSYSPGSDPVQLTTHDGVDTMPMVASDGTIYWINDNEKDSIWNVWRMNADGSNKQRITNFKDDGVRWADLSHNSNRMIMERGTKLYAMDLPNGRPFELEIQVASDDLENPVSVQTFRSDAEEVSISGDGEEYALLIHGDIILVNKELGGRAVVPIPDPSREENIAFRPGDNADTLAFTTDRYGEKAICLLVSDDEDESNLRLAKKRKIIKLTNGKIPAHSPVYSPDGSKIAYTYGNGDIHIMDHDGGHDRALDESWSEPDYSWAPDGNWIAFSREDRNFNSDVWIIPAEGGEKVNISTHPDEDFGPVWAADGSMISWTSRRHDNQYDVFYTYLTKELDERTREEWEIWEKTRDNSPKDIDEEENGDEEGEDGEEVDEEEEEFVIDIDFDDIYLRARRATNSPNPEYAVGLHPKGDKIAFMRMVDGDGSLNSVNRFAEDEEEIASGDFSDIELVDETFYMISGGQPGYVDLDGGSVETTDFNARLTIDKRATRRQVIDEGYRTLKHWFYDPNMHGIDWDEMGEKYGEWAANVAHDKDFADVVNMMLGELNASHMGYYPDGGSDGDGPTDGFIGVEFDADYTGDGLRVKWVLPNGPADETDMTLLPGDIVSFVNDMEVGRDSNVYAALEDQEDVPTAILWERDGEEMEGEIVPVAWYPMRELVYEDMEIKNRAHVE
ncbi:MAG TPA: hypothetical protein ENH10_10390, partial [Bacteroidetes bacterium]|nr:hypothetical protein [Bacteroidota bacterium]HEX05540.1 hypothetical protein [Bacteroidota bacterium]